MKVYFNYKNLPLAFKNGDSKSCNWNIAIQLLERFSHKTSDHSSAGVAKENVW